MRSEKSTDIFIARLLDDAGIAYTPAGSPIKDINSALKVASKKMTGHVGRPEFVAQSGDFILVIENKASRAKQALYEDDACTQLSLTEKARVGYAENGALHYAQHIAATTSFQRIFAFGCSGNARQHIIRPIFVDRTGYRLLECVNDFSGFAPTTIQSTWRQQVLGEETPRALERERLLVRARELHDALRTYGQLEDTDKPLVVSALLLALNEPTFSIFHLKGDDRRTDGKIVFDHISTYMDRVEVAPPSKKEKVLGQFTIIKDNTTLNTHHPHLGKTPLRYFAEYLRDHILNGILENTADDILGRLYGEFIRFSSVNAQSLGVVLTPRHITRLFCDLVSITPTDRIFDPCCGTAGFLIAGMHAMLEQADTAKAKQHIKREQVFGVEIRESMFSIATTNMILRGDGKSNLDNRDFFNIPVEELRARQLTVGFINPPYSQGKSPETAHLSELSFIQRLLDCLADAARCVAIVPQSIMAGRDQLDERFKQDILKAHTLEGVLTLGKHAFHGVGVTTCIAVFTAHQPHPETKRVKFIDFRDDGYEVQRHVGLIATSRVADRTQRLLDWWFDRADADSADMLKATVRPADEWLHAFYWQHADIPSPAEFERTMTDALTFEFNQVAQGRGDLFPPCAHDRPTSPPPPLQARQWVEFKLADIFDDVHRGKRLKKKDHVPGHIPYVSSTALNNGVDGFVGNTENVRVFERVLTIANSGSVGATFFHPYRFIASDHVTKLGNAKFSADVYLFLATVIRRLGQKYGFNREITEARLNGERVMLPVTEDGQPDHAFMGAWMSWLRWKKESDWLEHIRLKL